MVNVEGSLSADLIAQQTFPAARRGFDPDEVRAFLVKVAAEVVSLHQRQTTLEDARRDAEYRAAHPSFDEDTLLGAVGEETAHILKSAHDAAGDIRARAEENASRILKEAHQKADALRADAETVLARRSEEAETFAVRIREAGRSEAERLVDQARQQAKAVRAQAEAERTAMVEGAQVTRDKILSSLSKKRNVAIAQVEALRAGRERLLASYEIVKRTLDEAMAELARAEADARAAAAAVRHRPLSLDEADGLEEDPSADPTLPLRRVTDAGPAPHPLRPGPGSVGAKPAVGPPLPGGKPPAPGPDAPQVGAAPVPVPPAPAAAPDPSSTTGSATPPVGGDPEAGRPEQVPDGSAPAGADPAVAVAPAAGDAGSAAVAVGSGGAAVGSGAAAPRGQGSQPTSHLAIPPPARAAPVPASSEPCTIPAAGSPAEAVAGAGAPKASTSSSVASEPAAAANAPAAAPTASAKSKRSAAHEPPGTPKAMVAEGPAAAAPRTPVPVIPVTKSEGTTPRSTIRGPKTAATGQAPGPSGSVESLFARIRADRERAVSRAKEVLAEVRPEAADEQPALDERPEAAAREQTGGERVVLDGDEAWLQRRDELVGPIEANLVRRLKRALQDDQNDLLDRLRHLRATKRPASVLTDRDAHAERFGHVGGPFLSEAFGAGAAFTASFTSTTEAAAGDVDRLAEALTAAIVDPLRKRLQTVLAAGQGDDPVVVAEAVGAAYREWKTRRVEVVAADHVANAFAAGAYATLPGGVPVRWLVDDTGGACPDCDDNALAGPQAKAVAFPTGQRRPPAHPGCRCLLVPPEPD